MKTPTRLITVIAAVLLLTLGVLAVPRSFAATDEAAPVAKEASEPANALAPQALRAISIPFGVESTLTVSSDGSEIQVEGHAECPEEMDRFTTQAVAAQDDPGTYGASTFTQEFTCQSGEQSWQTTITAQDGTAFVEGDAWVCVTAFFFPASYGETAVFRWCYENVTLEMAQQEEARLLLPVIIFEALEQVGDKVTTFVSEHLTLNPIVR